MYRISFSPNSTVEYFSLTLIEGTKAIVDKSSRLIEKVQAAILPIFKAGSSLFLCGFGLFETYLSLMNDFSAGGDNKNESSYLAVHGTLLIGTGFCTGLEALQAYSVIDLGKLISPISHMGGIFFLFANLLALQKNIAQYELSCKIDCATSEQTRCLASLQRESAIFGFLSNLGYITASCLALYGISTAVVLLLLLSASFGGLNILCELLASSSE